MKRQKYFTISSRLKVRECNSSENGAFKSITLKHAIKKASKRISEKDLDFFTIQNTKEEIIYRAISKSLNVDDDSKDKVSLKSNSCKVERVLEVEVVINEILCEFVLILRGEFSSAFSHSYSVSDLEILDFDLFVYNEKRSIDFSDSLIKKIEELCI